jgi:hypothetical protein
MRVTVVPSAGGAAYPGHLLATVEWLPLLVPPLTVLVPDPLVVPLPVPLLLLLLLLLP